MEPENKRKEALKVAAVYLAASVSWILLSDAVLGMVANDVKTLKLFGVLKGLAYAISSGLLIYLLVLRALGINRQTGESRSRLMEYESKLHHLAYFDQLTGVPNRMSYSMKVEELINKKHKFALLYLDLDNFKYVNDTLGHTFGDRLLKKISGVWSGLLDDNCTIYRISGDKFAIISEGYNEIHDIEKTAVKLLKETKKPVEIDGRVFYSTTSIGISIYPDHGGTADELLKSADIAMFKAKEAGKNRIVIYSESMNEPFQEWVNIEKYLHHAMENSEFELYYQPQYDAATMEITGFEALIRWRSDEFGFTKPSKFLKVSEDTHLIIPIGEWVLRNACIFIRQLYTEGYENITVSVNVSKLQLLQDDFVDFVVDTVEMAKIKPESLEIDIAESVLVESSEAVAEKMRLLKKHGIKIALDDFGKGYSSLNYLRQLPVTTLKIDKSFVQIISGNDERRILTDFIVKAGKSMNIDIVAVGVETKEQFDYLSGLNCNKVQGYLFSRPLPEKDALEKLQKHIPGRRNT
ncbi:MAG: putative bifunctional diguanylate cyclase/phosphodiesterase [Bacillota bacterium]